MERSPPAARRRGTAARRPAPRGAAGLAAPAGRLALALAVALAGAGCGHLRPRSGPPAREARHVVAPGETLSHLAVRYGVTVAAIARHNGIDDPDRVLAGRVIRVPDPVRDRPPPARPPRLSWPVRGGVVSSPFGPRWGRVHEGIDIAAEQGTAVRAAAPGVVLHAGALRGYGNVVIVDHGRGLRTVYAHNRDNLVRQGDSVRGGQRIARVGATGRATGPHLHFEVRTGQTARDPLRYLGSDPGERNASR